MRRLSTAPRTDFGVRICCGEGVSKPHGDDLFYAAGIKWQMSRELHPKIIGINEVTNN
jgi:hypothetical protein